MTTHAARLSGRPMSALYVGTCTCRRWQGRRLASWSAAQWAAAKHVARTHGTSTSHYGEVIEVTR